MTRRCRRSFIVYWALVALFYIGGCGDGTPTGPGPAVDVRVASDVAVATTETSAEIMEYNELTGELTVETGGDLASTAVEGSVIVSDVSSELPNGFLGRVLSVSTEGDETVIATSPATLEDLFEHADIAFSRELSPGDVDLDKSVFLPGVAFDKRGGEKGEFIIDFGDVVLSDADGNLQTTNDQLRLNGSLTLDPRLEFEATIRNFTLQDLRFVVGMEEEADIRVFSQVELLSFSRTYEVARFHVGTITIAAGPVPIVFSAILTINVGAEGALTFGVSTGITQSATISAGLEYSEQTWAPVHDFSNSFEYDPPTPSLGCSAKVYAGPQFNLLLYGFVGPFANVQGYAKLQVDALNDPWWALYGGLEAQAGVRVEVLGRTITDYYLPGVIAYEDVIAAAGSGVGGSIVLEVDPIGLEAPWRLSGPEGFEQNGLGAAFLEDMPSGDYTVEWFDVDGWESPDPTSEFGTLEFVGPLVFTVEYGSGSDYNTVLLDFEDESLADWQQIDSAEGGIGSATIIADTIDGNGQYVLKTAVSNDGTSVNDKSVVYYTPSSEWSIQAIEYDFELVESHYNKMVLKFFVDGPDEVYRGGYNLSLDPTNARVSLWNHAVTPAVLLANVPRSFAAGVPYHLRLMVEGNTIRVVIDGGQVIEVDDATTRVGGFALGVGNAGVENNRSTLYDNVVVTYEGPRNQR